MFFISLNDQKNHGLVINILTNLQNTFYES